MQLFDKGEKGGACRKQGFVCLQARKATMEDLDAFPARLALADAMKNILWVAENYDALEREFPNHPWNAVMVGYIQNSRATCYDNPRSPFPGPWARLPGVILPKGYSLIAECNAMMQTVETGLDVPQQLLDRMVASLYMRSISVQPDTVEALLHIADTLQVLSCPHLQRWALHLTHTHLQGLLTDQS